MTLVLGGVVVMLTCFALLQRVVPDDHHGVHHCRDPQGGDTGAGNGRHGWDGLLRASHPRQYTSDQHELGFFLLSGASSSLVYFGC